MRALFYDGAVGLEWRDCEQPRIEQATDALVRPLAVSTCDLDQAIIRGGVPGTEQPFPLGHEAAGEVVEVGSAVVGLRAGDLVAIPFHVSCGQCDRCAAGLPLYCRVTGNEGLPVFGIPLGPDYGGLFSELVRVPYAEYGLVRLPPNVSPIQAVSVGDNLTDAWRVVAPFLGRHPGSDVLIFGRGSVGLYAVDIARSSGAGRILYVDRNGTRRALAARYGAKARAPEDFAPDEHEYPLTFVADSDPLALRSALLATAPGGRCENVGVHFLDVELPLLAMHLRCVTFRSSLCNVRTHIPDVLRLLSSGRIDPLLVQTAVLPIGDAADAMRTAGFKPVFVRESLTRGLS